MGWQEGGMTKEEFRRTAVEVWARPYGKDNAAKAAAWVADALGVDRQHASRVSSLAALLQEQAEQAKSGEENLWPVSPLSPEAAVRSAAVVEWARPWAETIRQALFKTIDPPFATLEGATAWIEQESQQYQRQAAGRAKRLTAWQRQTREAPEGVGGNGFEAAVEIRRLTIRYPKDGALVVIPANSPELHRLATKATALAQATGWGEVQTVLYLLVKDREPVVPRYTLRVTLKTATTPEGEGRTRQVAAFTLNGTDLSFSELCRLYKTLRQQGIAKKPVTKRALEVWQFVQARRPAVTWAKCLQEWNAGHKKEEGRYTLRGFRKAWERVESVRAEGRVSEPRS